MNGRVHKVVAAVGLAALVVGISAAPAFALAPTVGSASPPSGPNTGSLVVNFFGTSMDTATAAALRKAGQADIAGTSFGIDSALQSHATFDLAGAVTGTWDVRVTNPDGTGVCSGCFTVTSANPSVSTATPNSRGQGSSGGLIVLSGSHFQNGALVAFSNAGITVDSVNFISAAELDVTIHISDTALTGAGNITVTNPDLGTGGCTSCFTVNAKPAVASSAPSTAPNTAPVTLTLTGTNYEVTGSATLTKTGQSPIAGSNWTRNTANSLSIDFDIVDAGPGAWVINIINGDGGPASCGNCFTITGAAPATSSASPSGSPQGTTNRNVSLIGANYFKGAAASFSGTGITVNSTTWVDNSHLTANITIASGALTGARDYTVTNTDSQAATCTGCFTVTSPVVVTFTGPSSLTGTFTAAFSRDVSGVTAGPNGNFVFGVTGSGTTLAASVVCKDLSDTTTSCAGLLVRKAILTPTARLMPGQRYTATVNPGSASTLITDSNGAPIGTTSAAFRGSIVEEETSTAVSYGWRTVGASGALGGSYVTEHLGGARASYTFTGTSLKWYTVLGPDQGTAAVSIDGVSFGRVDNYRPTRAFNAWVLFSSLTPGTHTLVIMVEGLKGSPIGRGTFISIDGMQPGAATLQVRPSFAAFWRTGPSPIASGGHYALADLQGDAVSFTFRGTSVAWYSILGPSMGRANVYLDGTLKGTADLYRPSAIVGRFTLVGLSDTVHTLRIVVLGTRSAASHGTYVTVDRFAVG